MYILYSIFETVENKKNKFLAARPLHLEPQLIFLILNVQAAGKGGG